MHNNRPGLVEHSREENTHGCANKGRGIICVHHLNACKHFSFGGFYFHLSPLMLDPERLHPRRLKIPPGCEWLKTPSAFRVSSAFSNGSRPVVCLCPTGRILESPLYAAAAPPPLLFPIISVWNRELGASRNNPAALSLRLWSSVSQIVGKKTMSYNPLMHPA